MFPLAKAEAMAQAIPGAELVVLEGEDHLVYVDQEAVLDAVKAFLNAGPVSPAGPTYDRVLTTVLFADIVGSTELAERIGDAKWRHVRNQFYEATRGEVARFCGDEIKTAGDGLLA